MYLNLNWAINLENDLTLILFIYALNIYFSKLKNFKFSLVSHLFKGELRVKIKENCVFIIIINEAREY